MNKLGNIIYYVKNVKTTMEFFEKAFGLPIAFIDDSGVYGQLETGTTALGFADEKFAATHFEQNFTPLNKDQSPLPVEIALCSKDVAASFKKAIDAGCTALTNLTEKPWGQTVGYVRTPDGILVEMASEMVH